MRRSSPNSGEGDTAKWNQNIPYLKQYALRFPAFEKMHKLHCEQQAAKEAATKKGDPGLQVVGFGQFLGLTFKELASSTNHKHVKYIEEFLLPKCDVIPGSAMYRLRQYVVDQRKSQSAPSVALSAQAASSSQSLANVSQQLSESSSCSSISKFSTETETVRPNLDPSKVHKRFRPNINILRSSKSHPPFQMLQRTVVSKLSPQHSSESDFPPENKAFITSANISPSLPVTASTARTTKPHAPTTAASLNTTIIKQAKAENLKVS